MSIVAYAPDDLTVSVTADTTLAELQAHLAERNQWLPLDPPHPDRVTLGKIVDCNLSGPRRYGHGTIREHLLGIRARLADGRTIRNGGAVVKNAAGYDLCRLFTGARGELGVLLEATFKVEPRPELERFVEARFPTVDAAAEFVERVDTSVMLPVALDLHRFAGADDWTAVVGFAGDRETVAWQCGETARFARLAESSLEHETLFWADGDDQPPAQQLSVLPSRLSETIKGLGAEVVSLVARAGNGVIHYRGGPAAPAPPPPSDLMRKLKHEFNLPPGVPA